MSQAHTAVMSKVRNIAKIESANLDRPLAELLAEIDFEVIADYWLARFSGYRRRDGGRAIL